MRCNRAEGTIAKRQAIMAAWLPSALRAHLAYFLYQCIAQKGFFNDRHTGISRTSAQNLVWLADNQNSRRRHVALAQCRNQLHPAHAGHALVNDKTAAVAEIAGGEKFHAATIGAHGKTLEFERKLQRIANGRIVIDNGDNRNRSCQFSFRHNALRGSDQKTTPGISLAA